MSGEVCVCVCVCVRVCVCVCVHACLFHQSRTEQSHMASELCMETVLTITTLHNNYYFEIHIAIVLIIILVSGIKPVQVHTTICYHSKQLTTDK